ncbi:sugar transporter domain-containing protein [Phthorimaea operculella]|nr:sugar transporter domain-containing protein [Phthorimaea operculella]
MDKDHALEEMMGKLGDFGRYQCFQFILHIFAAMTAGMHMLSLVTVAAVPDHRCAVPGLDNGTSPIEWNSPLLMDHIPLNEHNKLESCKVYGENRTLEECTSWVYNEQYFTSSRAVEWDFVCSNRWMGATAQTAYMFGVVVGSLVLGRLCDKFGRKSVFVWSGVLQLLFGVSVAFATDYYTFVAIRFLYGIFGSGSYIAGFVLTMELVGPSRRTICGVMFQIMFAVGIMLLPAWGYFIDNRFLLQIIYGLHSVILLPHWLLMDESPRWLWSQGRARESVAVIEKALKMNKCNEIIDTPALVSHCKATCAKYTDEQSAGTSDLFKSPNMLKKSLIICGCWFANSVVYYGLSLNTGKLNGNPYFLIFLMGVVELPSYVIIVYCLDRVGHRALISAMMLLGGIACLVVVALPHGSTAATAVVMVGKLFISGSYSIIYKYSAELFPTVVRSSGVGLGSMCASVSGALTPLISLLDTLNPKIPTILFAFMALLSGFSTFFLPETLGRELPQSLEDGERFGVGDTCFTNCTGRRMSVSSAEIPETMIPLDGNIEKKQCWIDGVDTNVSIAAWNSSEILAAIPQIAPGKIHNCLMYVPNNETSRNGTLTYSNANTTCSRWVFDDTYRSSSRAIEWELVCDKRWMGAIAQTVYMLGVFTGAVVLGGMADKYGRKIIFCLSGVLQLILGVVVAFIPEYWTFLVIRFLYGIFGSAGSYIPGFVLTMELVGPSKRTACGVAFQAAFAGGIILVAGWGALIDNRVLLQVIYGLHSLILIPHIWVMDESPRWLWAQGRAKESVEIVEKALKCNKSEHRLDKAQLVSLGRAEASKGTEEPVASAGLTDLFKTPNLRNKTLNVCLCWFANSIAYYGLTLNTGKLEGNPYLITAIMGVVEFPSYVAVVYFLDIWGRRSLISSMMLVGGAACIIATFMPSGSVISTAIVIAGKLFIAGSFAIIYNYSAELFPTVVRNSAMVSGRCAPGCPAP